MYDDETGLYYLNSRYYDAGVGRFINADGYASTGQSVQSCNMFAYCENNPVNRTDPTGQFWLAVLAAVALVATCAVSMQGCDSPAESAASKPNERLIAKKNLDIDKDYFRAYNCYGNAIGKRANVDPTGYTKGDSSRSVFEAVKSDLGVHNVRELDSIESPISNNEYRVALKCGSMDYHFIRQYGDRWYNKAGTMNGLYVSQSFVEADVWYPIWLERGEIKYITAEEFLYKDETIYFAVKVGWDLQ